MAKKVFTIGILAIIIAIGFYQKNELLFLIKEGGILSVFISMLFVAICVFFPIIPFTVLGGIIGAIFGISEGALISLTGAMAGTMCFFFLTRYGFRDLAQKLLSKHPKAQEYENFFNRNSFNTILTLRLIPVIPAPLMNAACGLSKVNWLTFFVASTLGKIPNIVLLSFVGASFSKNRLLAFGIYGVYLVIIILINSFIVYRRMSKVS